MTSSSYIPHWLPPSCTVAFTFEIQNRSWGARFFLFISSTFITSIVHCDFHFWEYQNRSWAARILIMEVFFFPATRPSQGLFSRYDNSTNLIKHNHHHLHQKILVVSYSLAVFINFHFICYHLVCILTVDIVTNGTTGDRQYESPERKGWWLVEVEEEVEEGVEVEEGSRLDTFPGANLSRSDLCSYIWIYSHFCAYLLLWIRITRWENRMNCLRGQNKIHIVPRINIPRDVVVFDPQSLCQLE